MEGNPSEENTEENGEKETNPYDWVGVKMP